ncbi:unnamed protein product, partial [Rotaria sp. Silwood2]
MQVFTVFADTYCVLINPNAYEAYCIQNLISDTRIERQGSSHNLDESSKKYIGNRLLDIIKRGEILFGVPDSNHGIHYYIKLLPEYSSKSDKIKNYFKDLGISAQLTIGCENMNFDSSTIVAESLIKTIISRVPLQLCMIEMSNLVPLNNGRRERMDHLSSKSFPIDMKAREISFSYLDYLLNNINDNENIRIVGIIGRQSTGKSYLLNRIFRTRFAVAAGRCTDGIWMSYAFIDDTHFIILDSEGLFSDQRTDDEEMKLLSFLVAVCDITILSQDLGFSRFQDRLFSLLSQAPEKIKRSKKLFKGTLWIAIRDISNNNAQESLAAARKKFVGLHSGGKSSFLEQLFSNTFKIQLLHNFENRNFDDEINLVRQALFNYDNNRPESVPRWKNGQNLSDRLKILLIQLYTDDFIDSDEIHCDMKIKELMEAMRSAWARFYFEDTANISSNEQIIAKTFDNKQYVIQLNHEELYLDENASEENFDNICKFIYNPFSAQNNSLKKEGENNLRVFVNELILDVLNHRRQQVKQCMIEKIKKEFPAENDKIKERRTKFLDAIEQYMLSFKFNICLKKCLKCDLKCVKNYEHTYETKILLEKKKEELKKLQNSLGTIDLANTRETMGKLNEDILGATSKENQIRQKMNFLDNELKHLIEKENVQTQIRECDIKTENENKKIQDCQQKIKDIDDRLHNLLPNERDLHENTDQLLEDFDQEILSKLNIAEYKNDQFNTLIDEFHRYHKNNDKPENDLLCFSIEGEIPDLTRSISMMDRNIQRISKYSLFIQETLVDINKQLDNYKENLINTENEAKELEQKKNSAINEKEDTNKLTETYSAEQEEIIKELTTIKNEHETLSKQIDDKTESGDQVNSSIINKIQRYMKNLQDKRNNPAYLHVCEDYENIESTKQEQIQRLEFSSEKQKRQKNRASTNTALEIPYDTIKIQEVTEEVHEIEEINLIVLETINDIQKRINDTEEHESILKQIDEEFNQLTSLIDNLQLSDEKIQSSRKRLPHFSKKIVEKKKLITQLEKDDPCNEIDQEKQACENLEKQYEQMLNELKQIEQQISTLCDNDPLLIKILNDPEIDLDKERQVLKHRFNELSDSVKALNEKNELLSNNIVSNKAKLDEKDQKLLKIKEKIEEQNTKHKNYMEEIHSNEELYKLGDVLLQSLTNTKNLLNTNLKRLNNILLAKDLIHKRLPLLSAVKSSEDNLSRLTTDKEQLNKRLNDMNSIVRPMEFANSHECNEKYQQTVKEHQDACSHMDNLEKIRKDIDTYSDFISEIKDLEREAQDKCDCGTDHKCSAICQICVADNNKESLCMFKAGHYGEHKCDGGHICIESCQICEIYGKPKSRCHYAYGHKEPAHHQCGSTHQCPSTCICSDPCTIPLTLERHDEHQCLKKDCWKMCIFSCGKPCATPDHKHDTTASLVTIVDGRETRQVKRHLCSHAHYCKGICDAPGICKLEYKIKQTQLTTESGVEFIREYIEVEEVRAKCGIKISAGKSSHDDTLNHQCDGQHTCQERCPDCGSFCKNPFGHDGFHRTLHRNKEQHIFTSTNPNDGIEICPNLLEDTNVIKYKVGDSANAENCTESCKRRGRSHFHLFECPGNSECLGKVLGNKAKHSDDTYFYGPDCPSTKKYDKILCSAYWSQHKWLTPVSDADKNKIDLCNTYCRKHVLKDQNSIIVKDSDRGFCQLEAGHIDRHLLNCQSDHISLEMYQGIDVCFVIDTTTSMEPYFEKVKNAITRIIHDSEPLLKQNKLECEFKFSVVVYQDHAPSEYKYRNKEPPEYIYRECDFTNYEEAVNYVKDLKTGSGPDFVEACCDCRDS